MIEYTKAPFATEKTKKRRKKLDNLERDVLRAEALGYGCHYGRYKADHPHTKEDDATPERSPATPALDPGRVERECAYCGGKFYMETKDRKKYCSPECDHMAKKARERARNRALGKVGKPAQCPICKNDFISIRNRRYCSMECRAAGIRLNTARLREKRRKEAANHGND